MDLILQRFPKYLYSAHTTNNFIATNFLRQKSDIILHYLVLKVKLYLFLEVSFNKATMKTEMCDCIMKSRKNTSFLRCLESECLEQEHTFSSVENFPLKASSRWKYTAFPGLTCSRKKSPSMSKSTRAGLTFSTSHIPPEDHIFCLDGPRPETAPRLLTTTVYRQPSYSD